jgi:hypothetical protein
MEIVAGDKPLALATSRIVGEERFNPVRSQLVLRKRTLVYRRMAVYLHRMFRARDRTSTEP